MNFYKNWFIKILTKVSSLEAKMSSNPTSGLKYLILYHRITGNTYFNSKYDNSKSLLVKIILILASLLNLSIIMYSSFVNINFFYKSEKNKDMSSSSKTKKSGLFFVLFLIQLIGYSIITLFVFLILLIRGKHILNFLQNQDFILIDSKTERRIALKIILIQF